MNASVKTKVRNEFALKKIEETIQLDSKLLKKQINSLSTLTTIVNDEFGDSIIGAEQVLEMFEWLPKGEYTIKVKIV